MAVEQQLSKMEAEEELSFEAPKRESAEELLDAGAGDPLDPMRHSAAHVMAEAVMDLFPGTKLGIGPAIATGFYYDFDLPRPVTTDDLAAIEARMAESITADHKLVRKVLAGDEGRRFFEERGQPFKVEILDDLERAAREAGQPAAEVSTYEHGHLGGGAQWMLSTYGLQRATRDGIRGRVFSFDYGLVTLMIAVSTVVAGTLSEVLTPHAARRGLGHGCIDRDRRHGMGVVQHAGTESRVGRCDRRHLARGH